MREKRRRKGEERGRKERESDGKRGKAFTFLSPSLSLSFLSLFTRFFLSTSIPSYAILPCKKERKKRAFQFVLAVEGPAALAEKNKKDGTLMEGAVLFNLPFENFAPPLEHGAARESVS